MLEPDKVQALLIAAFPGADIDLVDLTGTRDHYQVALVAEAFRGQSRMQQHRLVYRALGELMRGPIHALSLQTSAPSQAQ